MHTDVILTNKRRIHAQSNYSNTKLKAWGLIDRHCHKIYLMICLMTITTQKSRYPKIIMHDMS